MSQNPPAVEVKHVLRGLKAVSRKVPGKNPKSPYLPWPKIPQFGPEGRIRNVFGPPGRIFFDLGSCGPPARATFPRTRTAHPAPRRKEDGGRLDGGGLFSRSLIFSPGGIPPTPPDPLWRPQALSGAVLGGSEGDWAGAPQENCENSPPYPAPVFLPPNSEVRPRPRLTERSGTKFASPCLLIHDRCQNPGGRPHREGPMPTPAVSPHRCRRRRRLPGCGQAANMVECSLGIHIKKASRWTRAPEFQ